MHPQYSGVDVSSMTDGGSSSATASSSIAHKYERVVTPQYLVGLTDEAFTDQDEWMRSKRRDENGP